MSIVDFLWNLGLWNWFILAVILFLLETVIPGVHFVWFGLAAFAVGALSFFIDVTWQWQLVIFAAIACATVFFVRRYAAPDMYGTDEPDLNIRAAQYIGREVLVEEAISGGRGKVRVGDTVWPAQGSDAAKGARVKITGNSGTVLIVEPVTA